jgi:hypothetical protein
MGSTKLFRGTGGVMWAVDSLRCLSITEVCLETPLSLACSELREVTGRLVNGAGDGGA